MSIMLEYYKEYVYTDDEHHKKRKEMILMFNEDKKQYNRTIHWAIYNIIWHNTNGI